MKTPAFNPYLPGYEYIPDGEPHVFGGRVYVYGSHDRFDGDRFCMENYVCWSAPEEDLGAWRFEGEIYDKTRDPLCTGPDRLLFAPDVCRGADGRYYLYYAFDFEGIISVAVCDSPAGRYEFYGHVRWPDGRLLGRAPGDPFLFDPAVLADIDGSVYLFSGLCRPDKPKTGSMPAGVVYPPDEGPLGVRLGPDMLTVVSRRRFVAPCWRNSAGTGYEGHEFFEAPSVRRVGDTYYFIYSSLNGHELCWARSRSPLGPFAFGGTLVSNGDIFLNGRAPENALNYTGNNHGSIVEIGGRWYVFYHRHSNRRQFSRQGCAEEIHFAPDGSIPQAEITSCGLNSGPLPGEGEYEARIVCNLQSAAGCVKYPLYGPIDPIHPYLTQDREGRQYIANLTPGSVAGYKYFDLTGTDGIALLLRGPDDGKVHVRTAPDGEDIAVVEVRPGREWTVFAADLTSPGGVSPLYLFFDVKCYSDLMKITLKRGNS